MFSYFILCCPFAMCSNARKPILPFRMVSPFKRCLNNNLRTLLKQRERESSVCASLWIQHILIWNHTHKVYTKYIIQCTSTHTRTLDEMSWNQLISCVYSTDLMYCVYVCVFMCVKIQLFCMWTLLPPKLLLLNNSQVTTI